LVRRRRRRLREVEFGIVFADFGIHRSASRFQSFAESRFTSASPGDKFAEAAQPNEVEHSQADGRQAEHRDLVVRPTCEQFGCDPRLLREKDQT